MAFSHENSTMKRRGLDCAIGSSLACAACLDLAGIKQLLDMKSLHTEKEELSQIPRMLVGLRKSWAQSGSVVREDSAESSTQRVGIGKACDKVRDKARDKEGGEKLLFHYETHDVYRVSIEVAKAFCSLYTAGVSRTNLRLLTSAATRRGVPCSSYVARAVSGYKPAAAENPAKVVPQLTLYANALATRADVPLTGIQCGATSTNTTPSSSTPLPCARSTFRFGTHRSRCIPETVSTRHATRKRVRRALVTSDPVLVLDVEGLCEYATKPPKKPVGHPRTTAPAAFGHQ